MAKVRAWLDCIDFDALPFDERHHHLTFNLCKPIDMVPDDASKTPEAQLTQASSDNRHQELVQYFLDRNGFCPNEKYIVQQRLMSDKPLTLKEIGREFGLSRERVRQIETRVIDKLQRCADRLGLGPEDVFD